MASGRTRIQFPLGGLDRRRGYQDQPPYTTPDCLNVWPKDPIRFRERGGSRPGLVKLTEEPSSSYPLEDSEIILLNSIDIVDDESFQRVTTTDEFNVGGEISSAWRASATNAVPDIYKGEFASAMVPVGAGGTVSKDAFWTGAAPPATFPANSEVERFAISIFISPYEGQHWGKYRLYAFCNNTTPDPVDDHGFTLEIDLSGAAGDFSGTISAYAATVDQGSTALTDPNHSTAMAGWLTLVIYKTSVPGSGADAVKAFWCGTEILDDTLSNLGISGVLGSANDTLFGFGMVSDTAGKPCLVDSFHCQFVSSSFGRSTRTVCLAGGDNGKLIRHDRMGGYSEIDTTNDDIGTIGPIESTEYFQDLWIADYSEPIASGTNGVISTTTNPGDTFDSATYSDWTTITDLDIYNYCVRIDGQGDFMISGVAAGSLTLREYWYTTNASSLSFRIFRAPKVYDSSANDLTRGSATVNKGLTPCNCRLVASFSDRVWFAGDPELPNAWYASRMGDPRDWDFGAADEDGTKAIASTSAGAFSTIGDPITALIPASEDYFIFGCSNSIFQLRGDPGFGGSITSISREIGVVGPRSWCRTPEGVIVFLSQDGIYQVAPNSVPLSISRERLPEELRNLSNLNNNVTMAYDVRFRGVWIHVSAPQNKSRKSSSITQDQTWWMDWETKTFWPIRFKKEYEPGSMMFYKSDSTAFQRTIIGGKNGNIYSPNLLAPRDEDDTISSYIDIGPISLGGMEQEGILRELSAALDTESGTVDWSLKTADTLEEAIDATAVETGEWTAGQNTVEHPRQRGEAMVLRLAGGDTARHWALERINTVIDPAGRQRL